MNDIMCDLEALDSQASAIIISVGLVYFDLQKGKLGEELYLELGIGALKEQRGRGRTWSLDTMAWWAQQSDEARKVWAPNDSKKTNGECLSELEKFFNKCEGGKVRLWGNGSTYDNMCLRSYFQTFTKATPFHYSRDMCYRTMKNVFGNRAPLKRIGTHHNGLDDAKTQAQHLIDMYKTLK